MKSIKEEVTNSIEVKKSEFICSLKKVDSVLEAKDYIIKVHNKYPNANHHCFGYIISSNERCSDDGEPSGTAGLPILNVLKHNDMDNIVCVVSRVFGGVKLGAGGLVRAYSKSVSMTLEKTEIVSLVKGYVILINFDYKDDKVVDYKLKEYQILQKSYENKINYQVHIKQKDYEKIVNLLKGINHLIEINIIKEMDIVDE